MKADEKNAIVVHAALYFPITVWGLYYWARTQFSFSAVRGAAEATKVSQALADVDLPFDDGFGRAGRHAELLRSCCRKTEATLRRF